MPEFTQEQVKAAREVPRMPVTQEERASSPTELSGYASAPAELNALQPPSRTIEPPERTPELTLHVPATEAREPDPPPQQSGTLQWIRHAYSRHLSLSGLAVLASGASYTCGLAAGMALEALAGKSFGTTLAMQGFCALSYWGTLLPGTAVHDLRQARSSGQQFNLAGKVKEYAAMVFVGEITTTPFKLALLHCFVKYLDFSLAQAQTPAFLIVTAFFIGGFPLLKQGLEDLFRKPPAKEAARVGALPPDSTAQQSAR